MDLAIYPPRPEDPNDPEIKAARDYLEAFGRQFSERLATRRVKNWLFGPSPDGKTICGAFGLENGESLEFSFKTEDIDSLAGVLGIAWRMAAELSALHGKQDGNG